MLTISLTWGRVIIFDEAAVSFLALERAYRVN